MTGPLDTSLLLALSVVGLTWSTCGVLLATWRSSTWSGMWSLATGVVLLAGGGVEGVNPAVAELLLGLALLVLAPLAVITYPGWPTVRWYDVASVAAVVITGAWLVTAEISSDAAAVLGALLVTVLVLHMWWRWEGAPPSTRRALLWLMVGLGAALVWVFVFAFVAAGQGVVAEVVATLALGVPPVTMVIGVRVPEVVQARALLVSGVVVIATLIAVVAAYVAVLSWAEIVLGDTLSVGWQAVVAAACALLVAPTRTLLNGVVDRLLFGDRPDPLAAMTRVAQDAGDDPSAVCRALREGLALPYVALEREDESEPLATNGAPTPHTRKFEIPGAADEPKTRLVVGLRPGDLRLTVADATVLRAALPLVAQTLRTQRTAEQLRLAQQRTLTAVAEERRRLRRELHDGLGPRLTGIAFSVDAAANLTADDSAASKGLLRTVRDEVGEAVSDLRRLVYGLRPPDLDQLGLVGAIRQQGELLLAGDRRLVVRIDDRSDVESRQPLPAAVEVAAYRIVVEALTNIARHTDSPTASVVLRCDEDALQLTVTDTGSGTEPWSPGVGITSMHERAGEIGGVLSAGATDAGGRVLVRLPLTFGG